MRVMFDTNVFNHLLDGSIDPADIPDDWEPVATHIQWDELNRTSNETRRSKLLAVFGEYVQDRVTTSSAVWDTSVWDAANWTGPESRYGDILAGLDKIRRKENNISDALIGDTCLQEDYTLVTNDQNFRNVIGGLGGTTINLRRAERREL